MDTVLAVIEYILLAACALPVAYLLLLMIAAAFYRTTPSAAPSTPERFVILVPAHDEALTIAAAVSKIVALRGFGGLAPRVVVVADNCTDNTAELAQAAGAEVWQRSDMTLRGKGHALQWAIERLMRNNDWDSLVIFDADTLPHPDFLRAAHTALAEGHSVLQGCYDVLNPDESSRTRLTYAAFVIYNHIRPLGRRVLGLSDGLRGNGMVFRRAVLERQPWQAFSLVEDIEYTTRLVLNGLSVTYVPQARLYGQAAATRQQATSQRMRWEGGRLAQAKQDVPPLLRRALVKADLRAFDRAVDLIIPPLALLVLALVSGAVLNFGLWLWLGGALGTSLIGWLVSIGAMMLFVVGGLAIGRTPLRTYAALLFAPGYVIWKLFLYVKMMFKRAPREWVRTARSRIDVADEQPRVGLK